MNLLNETLRSIRVQIVVEKSQEHPDMERLEKLHREEENVLNQLLK